MIEYYSKFYDESTMVGLFCTTYSIDVLNEIVSPLYEVTEDPDLETKNFNLFIYVNDQNVRTGEILYPQYDKPVYFNSDLQIPQADFDNNMTNLFVETVFTSTINGIEY